MRRSRGSIAAYVSNRTFRKKKTQPQRFWRRKQMRICERQIGRRADIVDRLCVGALSSAREEGFSADAHQIQFLPRHQVCRFDLPRHMRKA